MVAGGHASSDAVLGVTLTFTILAVFAVGLRLYTRFFMSKAAGADDTFVAISTALTIAQTVTVCGQVKYGLSQHGASLTKHQVLWSTMWFWNSIWIYQTALSTAKMCILLQCRRVFPQGWFRRVNSGLIAFVVVFFIWTTCNTIFACVPVQFFWNRTVDPTAKGKCLNQEAIWFSNAGLNILSDCGIAIAPLPILKSLNLPKRQKIGLAFVFCIGGITCVASLLRLQAIYVASTSKDPSWDGPMAAIWSSLEVNTCIICSCMPILKGCISQYFPRLFSSIRGSGYSRGMSAPKLPDSAADIDLDHMAQSKANTAICDGPKGWDSRGDERERHESGQFGSKDDKDVDGIQVVRVVEPDTMDARRWNGERSDSDSTRKLVRGWV